MTDGGAAHFSIGDVLGLLRDEFPDITISKIRFLESQGLVDPERTPSGYRKFYEADVDRLRWILREQKENFLPLKVIKTRLEQLELGGGLLDATQDAPNGPADPAASQPVPGKPAKRATKRRRAAKRGAPAGPPPDDGRADDLVGSPTGASLTRDELALAAGLTDAELAELESYGLVWPTTAADGPGLFDEDALAVARLASGFAKHGIQARHLRMYRAFAEREAVLYQQTLLALLRQRNPEARARAQEQLAELAKLGRGLRTAYLRQAARELLGE
ncbi:MAG TPA: MerR family transcriptional regulator [Acidimicrobiia bacterium]|nr:MerR family transcriptional regulator [Acidimicrobiia bacterium]